MVNALQSEAAPVDQHDWHHAPHATLYVQETRKMANTVFENVTRALNGHSRVQRIKTLHQHFAEANDPDTLRGVLNNLQVLANEYRSSDPVIGQQILAIADRVVELLNVQDS